MKKMVFPSKTGVKRALGEDICCDSDYKTCSDLGSDFIVSGKFIGCGLDPNEELYIDL